MTTPAGEGAPEIKVPGDEETQDSFEGALESQVRDITGEVPQWVHDIELFQASHDQVVSTVSYAFSSPAPEKIDAANEAIAVARKNSELLFEKEFFRGVREESADENPDQTNAHYPLKAAIAAMAKAIVDLDKQLKAFIPLKISRDQQSIDNLHEIAEKVVNAGEDEREALEPLGVLSKKYGILCNEIQEALKAPSVTKAAGSAQSKNVFGVQAPSEWKREAVGLAIAGVVLFGATALGNIVTRGRRK